MELRGLPPKELILFGHSLGALIGYELAYLLHTEHAMVPRHLFVSGAGAPHASAPSTALLKRGAHALEDSELIAQLKAVGGTPAAVLDNAELLELVLPILRADLRLRDAYLEIPCDGRRLLPCGITAFSGTDDLSNVPMRSVLEWQRYTQQALKVHMFQGDHFFISDIDHIGAVTAIISKAIAS